MLFHFNLLVGEPFGALIYFCMCIKVKQTCSLWMQTRPKCSYDAAAAAAALTYCSEPVEWASVILKNKKQITIRVCYLLTN